ncbi:hypothetical protein [Micromonospora inaquosa]|uniref:Uncharacterized protein n=1 Tax=Micromonospora inaquosa TaxID=2203716 RepID=A0A3N9WCU8_9ACTN|nr:hypothetical protein [Micromonospora inaquosa]RQW98743.1 hypothetical protein DLJ59_26525 [Micromonospora inaquosa]
MQVKLRFLLVSTAQVAVAVLAFAFLMTLIFEPGEWRKSEWLFDLMPLLAMVVAINVAVQLFRLRRNAKK